MIISWQILGKKSISDIAKDQYHSMGDVKYYGMQAFTNPTLMVCDPEVVKEITVKAFDHFVDRSSPNTTKIFKGKSKTDQVWGKQMANTTGKTKSIDYGN